MDSTGTQLQDDNQRVNYSGEMDGGKYIEPCSGIGGATEVLLMTYKHEATRLKIRQEENRRVREWVEEDHSGGVTSCIDRPLSKIESASGNDISKEVHVEWYWGVRRV